MVSGVTLRWRKSRLASPHLNTSSSYIEFDITQHMFSAWSGSALNEGLAYALLKEDAIKKRVTILRSWAGSYPINRRGTLARLGKRSVCCYNLPSVTNPTQPTTRKRGRPRLGDWRLEITLPATVKHELLRREEATGLYRSLGLFFIRTSTLAYADHVVFFKHQPAAIHIDLAFPDDPARRWHA
jgi:hypothetical protein